MTPQMQDLLLSASHARPELLLALFALVFTVVGAWFAERRGRLTGIPAREIPEAILSAVIPGLPARAEPGMREMESPGPFVRTR